ncbi:response regulator [Azoarcus sp. KH32C]|uniref:response regulator n=1 Tax=Azoarcus sp. KH32C TaxID=748247 RepID=UPI0002387092|nr:response regulator [Azoarcus sp. KH32C]BAL26694.1 putative histidine kinase [Azoarcus sp. KH32C]
MEQGFGSERPAFLATAQPDRGQRRLALVVIGISLAFFAAAVPFAQVQLPKVWAFIPVYQAAFVVCDLITAGLLFGQYYILRSTGLAVLAAGYLYTALMAILHALSFPGLFADQGLLGAGPQTTAWLYMFWHGGFPLFVIAYAELKGKIPVFDAGVRGSRAVIGGSVAAVVALAAALGALATSGHEWIPAIMTGNRYTPTMIVVVSCTWTFSLMALIVLWRRRPHSVLDLWLMVVAFVWMLDIALAAVLNAGRFDLGFYAGRIYGLVAASFVLMMLLLESGVLYTRLVETHVREREKSAELARLGQALEVVNAALEETNQQLQEASKRKSEFLANMSHELRTPLNAIIGFSEVLKDGLMGEMPPRQREFVADIFNSGRHLLSLINDILDLSKVEAGKMELDLERVEVGTLLTDSLSVVKEKAAAHVVMLRNEVPEGLPPICIDARKVKQILYNLLSNAVKFTPEQGRVTLRARRVGRAEIENWTTDRPLHVRLPLPPDGFADFLEVTVEDSGIGIKAEDAPRLFQPFSQLDSSLARRFEGTGLGLALVVKLALLHGGTVAVTSRPGEGSGFTVWLPWRVPEGVGEVSPASATPRKGRRLALVLEDNDEAAALLRVQLEAEDLDVLRVGSAEAALELIETERPVVIVLDILLPGADGWEFIERIKQEGSPWAETPVVICSILDDFRRGFSLGAAQVLQKPVSREDLGAALASLGLHASAGSPASVLIVDDDIRAVDLMAAYLAEPGYTVSRAYSGEEGVTAARRERPDLLVLDLMMPGMSGFEVVEALKRDPATEAIPIIVVTAKQLAAADRAALNGRVTAIVEKAVFEQHQFAAEVRRALAVSQQEMS